MKTFTVTIAGTERFDGEAPYTWVVEASDMAAAMNKAMACHLRPAALEAGRNEAVLAAIPEWAVPVA
jgi:hypothetical protein